MDVSETFLLLNIIYEKNFENAKKIVGNKTKENSNIEKGSKSLSGQNTFEKIFFVLKKIFLSR